MDFIIFIGVLVLLGGIIYVGSILILACRLMRREKYYGEKVLKAYDLFNVPRLDIAFFENMTEQLSKRHFTWLGDYKIEEINDEPAKIEGDTKGTMQCYARYFINETTGTLGTFSFCYYEQNNIEGRERGKRYYGNYFSLETALANGRHLYSRLKVEPNLYIENLRVFQNMPYTECHMYYYEGDALEMIMTHLMRLKALRDNPGLDLEIDKYSIEEIVAEWNRRNYALNRKIYKYHKKEKCYGLKLGAAIRVILR